MQTQLSLSDLTMRRVLQNARVIAVVGCSDKPSRTSYNIARFLRRVGYTIYPVNPTIEQVDDLRSYATLADIPEQVDIVNVFRRPEHLAGIVEESIAIHAGTVWGQLGVYSEVASMLAYDSGLQVVMDRCIKTEYARLIMNNGART